MGMCVCGHEKKWHKVGFSAELVDACFHMGEGDYCDCMKYRPAVEVKENLLTVTLILKDGMKKSDHAIDVGYGDKEIYVDWADGTTTYAKVKTVQSLLATA